MLTTWPFGPPPPRFLLRWRLHKELLIRLERWSEYRCLPRNPSKCEASSRWIRTKLTSSSLLFFNSPSCYSPTPTFLGLTFDHTLSVSKHASSLKAKFFPRLKAICCISASSWGCANYYFRSSCRGFASSHPLMLPSVSHRDAHFACPLLSGTRFFTVEFVFSSPCLRSDSPFSRQVVALADLDSHLII